MFRCSVWSRESHFEDVGFDLKELPPRAADPVAAPNGWCKLACFPTSEFRGRYDATSPWPASSISARVAAISGPLWIGTNSVTKVEYRLRISDMLGVNIGPVRLAIGERSNDEQVGVFEGKLHGDRFELEAVGIGKSGPDFPTRLWGTLRDDQMELSFGKGKTAEGTVALRRFVKAKK